MFITIAPVKPVKYAVTAVATMRQLSDFTIVRLCDSVIVFPSVFIVCMHRFAH